MSPESQKLSTFSSKIAEISLDLLESHWISPNMVEISWKSAWISSNLARNQFGSPRISSDFTKYGRDLTKISLDLLESPRIWTWSCRSCWICILHRSGWVARVLEKKTRHSTCRHQVLGVKTHHQPTGASVRVETEQVCQADGSRQP